MDVLDDLFGRRFTCLRLSLTEACNFRCMYCLPNGCATGSTQEPPLSLDEIRRLVSAFSEMGVSKIRFTGGEPTLRKEIINIAAVVSSLPEVKTLAITTNGYRLKEKAHALYAAGISALNISVDSLDRSRFEQITGHDRLDEVLEGLDLALNCGFSPVKLNTVLLRDINRQEIDQFVSLTKKQAIAVRFIELMETHDNQELFRQSHCSAQALENDLRKAGWEEKERRPFDGPAKEFTHPDYLGSVGTIAPHRADFCASCNRLRVDSYGYLHLCLFGTSRVSLRKLLGHDEQKAELQSSIRTHLLEKPASRFVGEERLGLNRNLATVGG